jgi:hypothetical protein
VGAAVVAGVVGVVVAVGVDVTLVLPLEQAVAVSATTMAPATARPDAAWNLIVRLRKSRSVAGSVSLLVFIVFPAGKVLLRQ